MNFHFFDSRPFQMSSSELKLYFITYYRPLVYFEVFSTYLSVFHEFMWSPKKAKKTFLGFFEFFFPCFREGGGIIKNFHEFSLFFDSRHFQMLSSELKLYFIRYYRHIVYFEVFSIYLSVFHEFMWSPKKSKKNFFLDFFDFLNFFFLVFARGAIIRTIRVIPLFFCFMCV